MKKIELGEKSKVCIKWKVRPIDYSEIEANNIIAKFAKKYGKSKSDIKIEPQFISVNKKGEEVPYTTEIISNIQDPACMPTLMKKYLEEREVVDYDFEGLLEIDKIINNKINFDNYDKCKRYTIKWIKWSNFMSYGPDNFFDFTDLNGLVHLSSQPANQGGKSTFCLDLFRFLLFGKVTSREDDWTLSRVFNDHLPEATECVVEGCICIDDVDYVIKRTITRPALSRRTEKSKVSQKISYYKLVNNEYIGLANDDDEAEVGLTTTETNKIIKEAIGNERDFDLMICVNDSNLKGLISLKDTERGRMLSRWIGLLPLEEKDKLAREHFNKVIMPSLYLNKYDKDTLSERIAEINTELEDLSKEIQHNEKLLKETEANIKGFRETKDTLLQSKKDIDENLVKADVNTVKESLSRIKLEGANKRAEKKKNEERLKEMNVIDFNETDYKKKVQLDKEMSISLNSARNECASIKKEIEALEKGEYCPTCGAKLKNVNNTEKIAEKKALYEEKVNEGKELKQNVEKLGKEILELEDKRVKYNERLKLELIIEKNDVDIEILLAKYRENERLLKDIEANEEAIVNNNRIETSLNVVNANIRESENVYRATQRSTESAKAQMGVNRKEIEESKKIIEIIEKEEKEVKKWKLYLDIVGKNGVSKLVLRTALPFINGELKRLLSGVCDFDVEVAIDDHNDVAFYLIHDDVKRSLAGGSGFEQTVASLALRSVLSKTSTFSKPSFVVFDEILGGVADENYENVKLLYDKIVADYAFIFQITHLKQIADWHNSTVVVKKENNISKIGKMK